MDKTTITVIDYQQITMNKMALAGLIMDKNVIGYKYFVMEIIKGLRFAIHLTDRHKKTPASRGFTRSVKRLLR
ncbi:hypothetical protein [Cellvibrio sp. KY-YJ-3]|jgi:hypothetical protein|uniref:hypothetical protein n=1 Tax=Cellvibrio sp. KY-YJ-3 TaxID=454662 RepID=UPI001247477A|nr:hypothetical protein [Cellvibrio sp. KY-YJ-3]QEY11193.1 hypothetical protein D0B88_02330 [Cellvibrio sp. KY-YJ-3]